MNTAKIILTCLCITISGCDSEKSPIKIFFIGNSQLGVADGIPGHPVYDLPNMLQDLSESAPAGYPRFETRQKRVDGASLKKQWKLGEGPATERGMIANGKWDYVVIQEIYYAGKPEFETYASLFDGAIRKAGAKTILFATAGVTSSYDPSFPAYPDGFKVLNDMQVSWARKMRIPVVAAGYAWIRYLGPDPSEEKLLSLYNKDKGHPGYKGSYIYACLLYAVITGKNPAGLTSEFKDQRIKDAIKIDKDEAARMQQAAWDQYLENNKK